MMIERCTRLESSLGTRSKSKTSHVARGKEGQTVVGGKAIDEVLLLLLIGGRSNKGRCWDKYKDGDDDGSG